MANLSDQEGSHQSSDPALALDAISQIRALGPPRAAVRSTWGAKGIQIQLGPPPTWPVPIHILLKDKSAHPQNEPSSALFLSVHSAPTLVQPHHIPPGSWTNLLGDLPACALVFPPIRDPSKNKSDCITPPFYNLSESLPFFWEWTPNSLPHPPALPDLSPAASFPGSQITCSILGHPCSAALGPSPLLLPLPGMPFPQVFKQPTPSGFQTSCGTSQTGLPWSLPPKAPQPCCTGLPRWRSW